MSVIHKKDTASQAIENILDKVTTLQETLEPQTLPELREMQLLQLQAQAEMHEQIQDSMLVLFSAIAEIYETIGGETDG